MYAIIYYMFYEVAVEGRIDEALTYESEVELCVGQIVMVPVMRKSVAGVVVKKVARPEFACKKITKILYSTPLPRHLVAAMKFIRDYYVAPMGSVASMVLPNGVEKKRRRAGGAIPSAACPSGTLRAALAKSSCPAGHTVPTDIFPGDPDRYRFPHPKVEGLDFSFSGLKTAVLREVQKEVGVPISYPSFKLKELLSPQQVCDFAASFQREAIEILAEKVEKAVSMYLDARSIVVAGGVSANEELRKRLKDAYFPAPKLSGDNGAMVGAAAYYEIISGVEPTDPYALNIYPRVSIES